MCAGVLLLPLISRLLEQDLLKEYNSAIYFTNFSVM